MAISHENQNVADQLEINAGMCSEVSEKEFIFEKKDGNEDKEVANTIDDGANDSTHRSIEKNLDPSQPFHDKNKDTMILPMSPNAMVEAAYKAGVEHRKKRDARVAHHCNDHIDAMTDDCAIHVKDSEANISAHFETSTVESSDEGMQSEDHPNVRKRRRLSRADLDSSNQTNSNYHEAENQLNRIWAKEQGEYQSNGDDSTVAFEAQEKAEFIQSCLEQTKKIVSTQLDCIIRCGLDAFSQNEELQRELAQMKEISESKGHEIRRLKDSEEDLRTSLSNLLKVVESSKASAREVGRAAQVEARLRGEVAEARIECNTALGNCAESDRKKTLLKEEVRLLQTRVARLTQEKIKVERDSRAALSLAKSMDSHAASDVDYYKRKVSDLNDHLQSKAAKIMELKHQVDEYKRQIERSISQNRLEQIRSEGVSSLKGNRKR